MRTQSLQRIENHRDGVMRAIGASGSGYGGTRGHNSDHVSPSSSARGWGGANTTNAIVQVRGLDRLLAEDSGRPKSAGGRLSSLAHLFEGSSRSPSMTQVWECS